MAEPENEAGRDDGEDPAEAAFDEYLRAALAGPAEETDAFLARHPGLDTEMRARVFAMHALAAARTRGAASAGPPDPGADPAPPSGAAGATDDDAVEPDLPFAHLAPFRILRRLGEGGMGTVYLAERPSLARRVAVKVVRPELARSPEALERFRREALALGRLRHPGLVAVHGDGEQDGVRHLVLEHVPGRSLEASGSTAG
jgi:hypothetical protein